MCFWATTDPTRPTSNKAEPLGCRDDCKFKGTMYEWSRAFADTLAPEIKAKFYRLESWAEQFQNEDGEVILEGSYTPALLANGTCDVFSTYLTKLPWRLKKANIITFVPGRAIVVIHESNKDRIKTLKDLGGKTTVDPKGGWPSEWFTEWNEGPLAENPIKFQIIDKAFTEYTALEAGEIDFVIADALVAMYLSPNYA